MRITPGDEAPAGELLPVGYYEARIAGVEPGVSKAGNRMAVVTLRIQDQAHRGAEVIDYLPFTDRAMWKIGQYAAAVGLTEAFELDDQDPAESLAGLLLGKVVKVKVVHDSYRSTLDGSQRTSAKPGGTYPLTSVKPQQAPIEPDIGIDTRGLAPVPADDEPPF